MIQVKILSIVIFTIFSLPTIKGTGRITPLSRPGATACLAENLRLTDRYICDSEGNVICVDGWSYPSKLCSEPICDMNGRGCVNGKCIHPNVCACEVGWDGPNCDECIPLGGCKHGSCNKPMECNCRPGWTGGQCNKPKCDGCVNGCCHEPYKCICDFGWKGPNCTECTTLSNCKNGHCITHPFQCECIDGWTGLDCSKPICRDSCHPVNGYCHSPGECICRNGWTGRDCNECVPYPGCKGTCVNNVPWTCTDIDTIPPGNTDEWSAWGRWSTCSRTCGDGTQIRARTCADHNGVSGNCRGSSTESRRCSISNCKIDGHWAEWTRWAPCSASCGTGSKTRFRSCSNPIPRYGGKPCAGLDRENLKCFTKHCAIDGKWSSWQSWGQCSASCGNGHRHRARECNSPSPAHGGLSCFGNSVDNQVCNVRECPIDASWSLWTQWTSCTKTCGEGRRERQRNCDGALFGGRPCTGNSTVERDVIPCWIQVVCSLDGHWSSWAQWSTCSTTCGAGNRQRRRDCNNPAPKFGGRRCAGADFENGPCSANQNCPIDGKWNAWNQWTTCSATCNGGTQTRGRTCIEPQFGGKSCSGSSNDDRACGAIKCPIDASWSIWTSWSTCTKTCGGGSRRRSRTCTPAQNGGQPCIGTATDESTCNTQECIVIGSWAQWGRWSTCSKSCDGGSRSRSRPCSNNNCLGNGSENGRCNAKPCGVDGMWGQWQFWGSCSVSCGNGVQSRRRQCDSPRPSSGGRNCRGSSVESNTCIKPSCIQVIDGNWGQWIQWSGCSATCGHATRSRSRQCDSPSPMNGGSFCSGDNNQISSCPNTRPCPIDGGFTEWTQWSQCTVDCLGDRGDQVRRRFCSNPVPRNGGLPCRGETKEKQFCTGTIPKQVNNPSDICFYIGQK
ncbi:Hemicentin-1,Thrombospondin-1,Adhesion G protein-coupled receptor B3,Thrombospondin-2,Adhesion G protein-coupled receptor B1,Mucin-like protein [Lepeophtheirus salmonis]|uniref:Female cement gland secreted 1 n=2 Tax=Lepeophtheirus salmonis TaxID=72036 RepID=A0A649ZUQ4_LEPSM|nr:female cement gland secreted 1 [Lepeophtheirus salmonis]CAB4055396.1 Hemicentin-1,Thrombospondin-1,Adhesion G protein-coupled receptor B3,Thrombospondin-2,Adhesion G protein-coupled receptor B1,Mucin-like protein [Lepeophtheirus salmonis]CAF2774350.1 Hemicentin-1,Thrombospondin-1,Adhesion G protein-coupled receptor B3,Thrombospondin-2,Adhesion G protein-coupled receptor B1,Mucin-like protein [Lepeophtheirus salmonis]